MERTKSSKLLFEKTINVFAWLCLVLAVILSIFTVAAVFSGENNGKEIFGHKILIVNTDSMSKSAISEDEKIFFNAGDIIIIRMIYNPSELKEGDVISFFSYNPESMGKTVTHKIRTIKYSATGEVTGFVTYGINTGVNDIVEVKPEHLVGKYVFKVPAVGLAFSFLKTPRGFYLSILIPGVLLIIFFSVKVGKILGKREFAKDYKKELDALKNGTLILQDKENPPPNGDSVVGCDNPQINQTMEETMEQNTEQTTQQNAQQTQGQTPPAIYQTVSITCLPAFGMAQPIVYQTAPGQLSSNICQSVSMMPAPVAYPQMPIIPMQVAYQPIQGAPVPVMYQPMPYQPTQMQTAPVVYQTIGGNVQTQPVGENNQTVSTNPTPTVCQTIGGNSEGDITVPVYQTANIQPMQYVYQPMPIAGEQVVPATVNTSTQSAPTKKDEETALTQVEEVKKEQEVVEQVAPIVEETESVVEQEVVDDKLHIPEGEKKPFTEKLVEAKKETQDYFNAVHNELVSYKKVSSRVSSRCVSYRKGRTLLAKIGLRGKTLTGYFNLNVKDFNEKVFFQKDMSAVRAYEEVPFAVKIKSERACNNATKLVGAVAEKFELVKDPKFEAVNQVEEFKKLK